MAILDSNRLMASVKLKAKWLTVLKQHRLIKILTSTTPL